MLTFLFISLSWSSSGGCQGSARRQDSYPCYVISLALPFQTPSL